MLKPSCCWQDPRRQDPTTKLLQRKTLGPEPSCCWQDWPGAAAGPAVAVGPGSARRLWGWRRDTASSSRDDWHATSERCHSRPGDTLHPGRASACGSGHGAAAGTACPNRRSTQDEIWTARTASGRNGNIAGPSIKKILTGKEKRFSTAASGCAHLPISRSSATSTPLMR